MNKAFKKALKKAGITEERAKEIIFCHHELKELIKKKDLVNVEVDLDLEALKNIQRISKALKVDRDAVVLAAMKEFIREENEKTRK